MLHAWVHIDTSSGSVPSAAPVTAWCRGAQLGWGRCRSLLRSYDSDIPLGCRYLFRVISVKGLSPLVDVNLFLVPVLLRIMFAVTIRDNFLHHFGRPRESGGSPVT